MATTDDDDDKPPPPSMRISLPGVLLRAAESLEGAGEHDRAFMLRKLLEHLHIVRGQPHRAREFFDLWVDDRPVGGDDAGEG